MHPSAALPIFASHPMDLTVRLAGMRSQIEHRLAELVPPPDDIHDVMGAALHEGVLAPGKRIRPLLMLLIGHSLGHQSPALLDLGCAVEMVHAASLFLDDMPCMDNARLRRGRLAVHARYGQDVAVLGAVALVSQSCSIAASVQGLSGELQARLVRVLCQAVGMQGLVRGQYRDLREGAAARCFEDIASTNQQKTGSLFSAGFEMAALTAGADEAVCSALRKAALELGQAFQLRDDIQDRTGMPASFGKDSNKDAGKSTLVALLGLETAHQRLASHLGEAQNQLHVALPQDETVSLWMQKAFAISPIPRSQPADNSPQTYRGLAA